MAIPSLTSSTRTAPSNPARDPISSEILKKSVTMAPCGHIVNETTAVRLLLGDGICPLDGKNIEKWTHNPNKRWTTKAPSSAKLENSEPDLEAQSHYLRAKELYEQGCAEDAIGELSLALELCPHYEKAQAYFEFIVGKASMPESTSSQASLNRTQYALFAPESSLENSEPSLDAQSHYLRGKEFFEKGNKEGAVEELSLALALCPDYDKARAYREFVIAQSSMPKTTSSGDPLKKTVYVHFNAQSQEENDASGVRAQNHYVSGKGLSEHGNREQVFGKVSNVLESGAYYSKEQVHGTSSSANLLPMPKTISSPASLKETVGSLNSSQRYKQTQTSVEPNTIKSSMPENTSNNASVNRTLHHSFLAKSNFYAWMVDKTIASKELKTVPLQDFLMAIVQEPENAILYCNLGRTLSPGEKVKLPDGEKLDKQGLFVQAIAIDPNLALAYNALGCTLSGGGSIRLLNGTVMTELQLYVTAISLDSNYIIAYTNLARVFPSEGGIRFPSGARMNRQDLYLKMSTLVPNEASNYYSLAGTLSEGGSLSFLNETWTKQKLYIKTIALAPNFLLAYKNLAIALPLGESIQLLNGTSMTRLDLYVKIIDLTPNVASAYIDLAVDLSPGGSIQLLNGMPMNKQTLYLKAISLDQNCAAAYNNLALTLSPKEKIVLQNKSWTQQELYIKAIAIDPKFALAYYNLANALSSGEKVQLNGKMVTKQDLLRKAGEIDSKFLK